MPRTDPIDLDATHLELLLAAGDGAPGLEQKLELARLMRGTSAERGQRLDQFFVEQLTRSRLGLVRAQAVQDELRALIERVTAPPFHLALFLGRIDIRSGTRALVMHAGSRRVVALADDVDLDTLGSGDEVLLSSDLNLLVARSPLGTSQYGDTAFFERATPDGRIVLRWRDEEVIVEVAGTFPPPCSRAAIRSVGTAVPGWHSSGSNGVPDRSSCCRTSPVSAATRWVARMPTWTPSSAR